VDIHGRIRMRRHGRGTGKGGRHTPVDCAGIILQAMLTAKSGVGFRDRFGEMKKGAGCIETDRGDGQGWIQLVILRQDG